MLYVQDPIPGHHCQNYEGDGLNDPRWASQANENSGIEYRSALPKPVEVRRGS